MKLLADVTEDVVVESTVSITLDLNGHKITNVSSHTITNSGTLTITDSSAKIGTIDNLTHAKTPVENLSGATCTILKANITRSQEQGTYTPQNNANGNSFYYIENWGTMTIGAENGSASDVVVESTGGYSGLVHNSYYNGKEQNPNEVPAYMTINSGTFTGGKSTVKNDDYGYLIINGGTFTNSAKYALQNWNVATINGGTFDAKGLNTIYTGASKSNPTMDQGVTNVYGGEFKSKEGSTDFVVCTAAESTDNNPDAVKISVYGGTFSKDPTAYVAAGYSASNSDSKFVVKKSESTVTAGDTTNSGSAATAGSDKVAVDNSKELAEDAVAASKAVKDVTVPTDFKEGAATTTIGGATVTVTEDQAADLAKVKDAAAVEGSKVDVNLVVEANTSSNLKTDEAIQNTAATSNLVPFELSVDMVATVKDANNNVTASANVPVTETKSAIEATIEVAKGDGEISRVAVARNHNGEVDMLPATFSNGTGDKIKVTFETNKFSDYAVALYTKGQSYSLAKYTNTDGTRKTIDPNKDFGYPAGEYAFAGWYQDAELNTPIDPKTAEGDAYPAFAKISDLIEFEGGSLRMDWTGESVYDMTSLRFGYEMKVPANATLDKDSWGWNVKNPSKPNAEPVFVKVENYWLADSNGAIANVVISPVHRTQYTEGSKTWYGTYATEYEVTAQVAYTTADGTKVTVSDQTRTRSVKDVATAIQNSSFASENEKAYAKGILG